MRGTTRTVTVLFTDVVGSTHQLTSLGPVAGDAARAGHFATMRAALAVHQGHEVKTLGDGIMATFDSAADAVACAVTMQRAVLRDNRRHALRPIAIRVGVSAGEVTCQDDDVFGIAVVEASRLCAEAGPGQVLTGHVVRLLLGDGGMHRLVAAGELALKGLPAPVTAWEVDWDAGEDACLRVALIDDAILLREGIASVLESEGMDVVLQASDADGLLESLVGARPHVVVVDVRMPPTHTTEGLDAARAIRAEHPDIGVLVLSQSVEPGPANRLLAEATHGIGYLLKERITDVAELTAAIRTIASGGSVIDPGVVSRLELGRPLRLAGT